MKVATGAALLTFVLQMYQHNVHAVAIVSLVIQVSSQMIIVGSCINCEHDFKWTSPFCVLLTISSELQNTVVVACPDPLPHPVATAALLGGRYLLNIKPLPQATTTTSTSVGL